MIAEFKYYQTLPTKLLMKLYQSVNIVNKIAIMISLGIITWVI